MKRPVSAQHREDAERLRQAAKALLDGVRSHDPVSRKAPAWSLEDRAEELELEATRAEAEFLLEVQSALQHADLPEAHALLADHACQRLLAAEARGDRREATIQQALLRAHDRGRYAAVLRGEGTLHITSEPPGAVVEAHRYTRRDRRLQAESVGTLGRTPLRDLRLPMGSYRLTLHAPGRVSAHVPVSIARESTWDRVPPGEWAAAPVRLPLRRNAPPGCVWVAGGWADVGGDPSAVDSLLARRVWVDPFWIQRFPVCNREWLEFLNAETRAGGDVTELVPRAVGAGLEGPAWQTGPDGLWRLPDEVPEPQVPWTPGGPVVRVSWQAAQAYAAWMTRQKGFSWILPDELEWVSAARGADGRRFPWGNATDGTWACTAESEGDETRLADVTEFPVDERPWGVRGMGGGVQQWCSNGWTADRSDAPDGARVVPTEGGDGSMRIVRGGSWGDAAENSRCAGRRVGRPGTAYLRVGLRLLTDGVPS